MSYLSTLFLWLTMRTVLTSELLNELTSILGEDPAERYNKTLASKSSTVEEEPVTRAPLIKFPNLPSTPKSTKPDSIDETLYIAKRGQFSTPTVPKDQFAYPFADRNTLRGSNSETGFVRFPPKAPITAIRNVSSERIPIKRPDLMSSADSRKSINTASVRKLTDSPNHSLANEKVDGTSTWTSSSTLDIVGPPVNLSPKNVMRILENGNNNNEFIENSKPRSEHDFKMAKSHFGDPTSKPLSSTVVVRSVYEEEKQPFIQSDFNVTDANKYKDILPPPITETTNSFIIDESTNVRMPRYPNRRVKYVVGSTAWNIHVYSAATLFAILAVTSTYTLLRVNSTKWMLPSWNFFAVHSLLTVIGSVRSIYFFYDAYNIDQSFTQPVGRLLFNVTFPLLVCLFVVMFLFVLKIVDLNADLHYADKLAGCVLLLVIIYTVVAVFVDLCADFMAYSAALTHCSQFLFIVLYTALGSTFILFYKYVIRSTLYKPSAVYGSSFTDMLKPCLAHTMRVMLAASFLSLLMAVVQLIGIVCVNDALNNGQPHHPWLWWAFQLSVRVIEASICYLIFWAAVQPMQEQEEEEAEEQEENDEEKEIQSHSASGFPLFACNSPKMDDLAGKKDDIYSSICSVDEASSRHCGNQIYEDVFQYCSPALSVAVPPGRKIGSAASNYATDERSLRRHQTRVDIDPVRTMCSTLRRGCPETRFVDEVNRCVVDTRVYLEEPRVYGVDSRDSTNSYCSRANGLYNMYRPFL